LRPDYAGKNGKSYTAADIFVGGLYAIREENGTCRIVKVLVVDEVAVHLWRYSNRFKEPPAHVRPSELSMGRLGGPEGFGIGHFPLARDAFDREERVLVGRESVTDNELEGYRISAGLDPVKERSVEPGAVADGGRDAGLP
jgi:hypothetical protein